ncbi:uncharacterized protein LOC114807608 [Ornithorhynchus anatinus]|uniref:uncharacterized protein LOC114807608 n=1 Tax=Ornithorhynchus anatinus TaxID=9258 RepID=UPI0019D4C4AE|nr:uncharacterized protein LOC114807608 [Ornithorhynchus anatinus]
MTTAVTATGASAARGERPLSFGPPWEGDGAWPSAARSCISLGLRDPFSAPLHPRERELSCWGLGRGRDSRHLTGADCRFSGSSAGAVGESDGASHADASRTPGLVLSGQASGPCPRDGRCSTSTIPRGDADSYGEGRTKRRRADGRRGGRLVAHPARQDHGPCTTQTIWMGCHPPPHRRPPRSCGHLTFLCLGSLGYDTLSLPDCEPPGERDCLL